MRVSELVSTLHNADTSASALLAVQRNFTKQLVGRAVVAGVAGIEDFASDDFATLDFPLLESTSLPSSPYLYYAQDRGVNITGTGMPGGTNVVALFEGTSEPYEVVLTSQPHADVTVLMEVQHAASVDSGAAQRNELPGRDLGLSSSELVFTPEDWDMAQTVVIAAALPVPGDTVEPEEDFTITHEVVSGDVRYNSHPCSPQTFEEGALQADSLTVVVMESSTSAPTASPTEAPTGGLVAEHP